MKKVFFALFTALLSMQMAVSACEAARGSFYTKAYDTVNPQRPILFDQQYFAPRDGLRYTLGTGHLVIIKGGLYTVSYGFAQNGASGTAALALDGQVVEGSQIFGNLVNQLTSATITFEIKEGQILSLINASDGAFELGASDNTINAYITVSQIEVDDDED